jgi:hypothetical protein
LTKSELLEASKTLFDELVKGDNDSDVADMMGWDAEQLAAIRKLMLESRAAEIRTKPREHVYIEYIIDQRRNVKDLTELITNLDSKQQYNALVGAIRLRSEITDKIVDRGCEFGLIKRDQPGGLGGGNTFNIIAGVNVGDMSTPQLRDAIGNQLKELEAMIKGFGDGKGILELNPGKLHYAKPEPAAIRRGGGKKRAAIVESE